MVLSLQSWVRNFYGHVCTPFVVFEFYFWVRVADPFFSYEFYYKFYIPKVAQKINHYAGSFISFALYCIQGMLTHLFYFFFIDCI